LGRSPTPRLLAVVILGIFPTAVALVVIAATSAISPVWVVLVIALGIATGGFASVALARTWQHRAERLDAVAEALERRQPPSHLIPNERDAMSRVERRLLEAADAVAVEVEKLDEQRDELEAILRSMIEAVVVTGTRGEVVLLNGAARRVFGLQPEAGYQGRDFVELCRDPRLQEFVGRATASDQNEVMTAELLIQNPAPRFVEVSAAPVRHTGGTAAARVFVFHDITRLKSYETVRSDFIANLTHELRTPLTALYGYAETLQKGVDDRDTQRRFLGIIERQSRRLARLIDDLISLSDLERGLTPLKFEPLAPARVLEEAAELLREQARRAGVALDVRSSHDLPGVPADRDRLHQVMLNLLDNALKYTPRGGTVTIEARAHMGGAGSNGAGAGERPGVEFLVADTGEGIPATDIPRLTERFYRVDRARSRELGGTGLGLAIVKHIVQLHHGTLRIESRLREGTTVTVWLPIGRTSSS
jgi:two-component system, OmpR family, phosphate regulon sensor histidine kinase PhoR